jgi:Cupin
LLGGVQQSSGEARLTGRDAGVGRGGRARPARELLAEYPPGEDGVVDLGGSGPAVHLISGEFTFEHDRAHPVLSLLPPLLHIPDAPATGAGELGTVVHMLATELAQPRPGSDTVVAHLADIAFVHILRAWLTAHDQPGPDAERVNGLRSRRARPGTCDLARGDPAVTAARQRGKQAWPLRPPLMPALAGGGRWQAGCR